MTPNSYNSTSAIGRNLLANQTSACVYSPITLTILETLTNKLQQAILKALLIKKYKPELYNQKQSDMLLLLNNLLRSSEENNINHTNSAGYSNFFHMFFFTPSWIFL